MDTVPEIDFTEAFYIKLGRRGCWEEDSIKTGKLRIGWKHQALDDINAGRWALIEKQLLEEQSDKPRGVTTSDLHALQAIVQAGPEAVWITFHQAKLWWTRLGNAAVEADKTSKFRRTAQPWSDRAAGGRLLVVNDLPGKIAQLQGFRGTFCRVGPVEVLRRTLNGVKRHPPLRTKATSRFTHPPSGELTDRQGVAPHLLRWATAGVPFRPAA